MKDPSYRQAALEVVAELDLAERSFLKEGAWGLGAIAGMLGAGGLFAFADQWAGVAVAVAGAATFGPLLWRALRRYRRRVVRLRLFQDGSVALVRADGSTRKVPVGEIGFLVEKTSAGSSWVRITHEDELLDFVSLETVSSPTGWRAIAGAALGVEGDLSDDELHRALRTRALGHLLGDAASEDVGAPLRLETEAKWDLRKLMLYILPFSLVLFLGIVQLQEHDARALLPALAALVLGAFAGIRHRFRPIPVSVEVDTDGALTLRRKGKPPRELHFAPGEIRLRILDPEDPGSAVTLVDRRDQIVLSSTALPREQAAALNRALERRPRGPRVRVEVEGTRGQLVDVVLERDEAGPAKTSASAPAEDT